MQGKSIRGKGSFHSLPVSGVKYRLTFVVQSARADRYFTSSLPGSITGLMSFVWISYIAELN